MEEIKITMWRECSDDPNFMERFDADAIVGERILKTEWEILKAKKEAVHITLDPRKNPE